MDCCVLQPIPNQICRIWHILSMRFNRQCILILIIIMTSLLARWRLKSPASPLFAQLLVQAQITENTKAPRHWPLCGEVTGNSPVTRKMFPFDDVIVVCMCVIVGVSKPEQNGLTFCRQFQKHIFLKDFFECVLIEFRWSVFLMVQLAVSHQRFM